MSESLKNLNGTTLVATEDDVETLNNKISTLENTLMLIAPLSGVVAITTDVDGNIGVEITAASHSNDTTIAKYVATSACVYPPAVSFYGTTSLESVDLSKADMSSATAINSFQGSSVKTIALPDNITTPSISLNQWLFSAKYLTEVTGNCTIFVNNMLWGYYQCYALKRFEPILDLSRLNGTNINMILDCFWNCRCSYIRFKNWNISSGSTVRLNYLPLDSESISYLLQNVIDVTEAVAAGTTYTLTLSSAAYSNATEDDLNYAISLGWTITH